MKQGIARINCSCQHEYQDKTYGKGVRVANTTTRQPTTGSIEVRCTVCSKTQTVSTDKVK